jgi:ectoine hydroxylase-related dioxygenase (phytanoyl-CoA dioxygenase family)
MSVLVAIDDCSIEAGCLWLAAGVDAVLPVDDRGVVRDDVARDLDWHAAPLAPGDAVCIDGLAPHYSDANRTAAARRVLVVSYSPVSEGYTREQYYDARRRAMTDATTRDGRFRISTLADFDGIEVEAGPDAAATRCTHP